MKKNNPKNKQQAPNGADLRFRYLELARRLSQNMLDEMLKENLTKSDIPVVLNDLCKMVILSLAEVNKENALYVVKEFTDLNTDITCLMLRIVSDNLGKGLKEDYPGYLKPNAYQSAFLRNKGSEESQRH